MSEQGAPATRPRTRSEQALHEMLTSNALVTVLAIVLATLGVTMLSIGSTPADAGAARWSGNALVLLAMGCEAVFLLLNKTIRMPVEPLVVATTMALLSLLFCTPPALYQWANASAPVLTAHGVGAAVYYAVVPTVLGFYLWYRGAASTSGAAAALFTAVYPVAALLLSAAVLGEAIDTRHWLGLAVTVLAIAVGALGEKKPQRERSGFWRSGTEQV